MITCWNCARRFDSEDHGPWCPHCEFGMWWSRDLFLLRETIRSDRNAVVMPVVQAEK